MKNIPVYTSPHGTATLILREIPMTGRAYVVLRTVISDVQALGADCARFCCMCGAQNVYMSAEEALYFLPHAYDILQLHVEQEALPPGGTADLLPIAPENDSIYQRIYNRCFQSVSHALLYDRRQIQRIYDQNQQAFLALNQQGKPYGIGELHGNILAAVAVLPKYRGMGTDLTLTLLKRCPGPDVELTVASDNKPALALYEKLGFRVCGVESHWYLWNI